MSLLIQALKQAERKNKLAAQQAANIDVELPPAAALAPHATLTADASSTNAPSADTASANALSAGSHPEESPLSLEVNDTLPGGDDFPSLHAPDEMSPSEPLEIDSLPVSFDDDEHTAELETRLPGVPDLPGPQDFPRQAEPLEFEQTPERIAPAAAPEPEDNTLLATDGAEPAPYLAPTVGPGSKGILHSARRKWILSAVVLVVIAGAVFWSPLVLTPGNSDHLIPENFPVDEMAAPTISPTGAYVDAESATISGVRPGLQAVDLPPQVTTPVAPQAGVGSIADESLAATQAPIASSRSSSATAANTESPAVAAIDVETQKSTPAPTSAAPAAPAAIKPPSAPAMPPIRFVRAQSTHEQASELLNRGYAALRSQRFPEADTAYRSALRLDRNLIDGWVGLASIASHQGNPTLAEQYYRRALQIDPNDAVARSGLLSLGGASVAEQAESTLRTLATNPMAQSTAQLTLGNTLAAQGRWREAQRAYFNANAALPDRPDVLFNLAVALERIHQPRPALKYYERALARADGNAVMFDPAIARQRIEAITTAQGS